MFGILMNLVYIFNRTFITTLYTGFAFVRQKGTSCSPIMSGFQSVKPMAIFPNQTPQFKVHSRPYKYCRLFPILSVLCRNPYCFYLPFSADEEATDSVKIDECKEWQKTIETENIELSTSFYCACLPGTNVIIINIDKCVIFLLYFLQRNVWLHSMCIFSKDKE